MLKIRIESEIKQAAAAQARRHGRTLSQHVRELIRSDLNQVPAAAGPEKAAR